MIPSPAMHFVWYFWLATTHDGIRIWGRQRAQNRHLLTQILRAFKLTNIHVLYYSYPWIGRFYPPLTDPIITGLLERYHRCQQQGLSRLEILAFMVHHHHGEEKMFWLGVQQRVRSGFDLCDSFIPFAHYIDPITRLLIAIGDRSQTQSACWHAMLRLRQERHARAAKIKKLTQYPTMILILSLFFIGFLLTTLLPHLQQTLSTFHTPLSPTTRVLFALSSWFSYAWPLGTLFVFLMIWWQPIQPAHHRGTVFRLMTKRLPVGHSLVYYEHISLWFELIGILLQNASSLQTALETVTPLFEQTPTGSALSKILRRVKTGQPLTDCLEQELKLQPDSLVNLRLCSHTQDLAKQCRQLACDHQQWVDRTIDRLMLMIEPAMMGGVAIVVGTMMLAVYLPILSLPDAMDQAL